MSLYTNNGMVAGQSASLIAEDPKGAFIPANSTIAIQPPVATGSRVGGNSARFTPPRIDRADQCVEW